MSSVSTTTKQLTWAITSGPIRKRIERDKAFTKPAQAFAKGVSALESIAKSKQSKLTNTQARNFAKLSDNLNAMADRAVDLTTRCSRERAPECLQAQIAVVDDYMQKRDIEKPLRDEAIGSFKNTVVEKHIGRMLDKGISEHRVNVLVGKLINLGLCNTAEQAMTMIRQSSEVNTYLQLLEEADDQEEIELVRDLLGM